MPLLTITLATVGCIKCGPDGPPMGPGDQAKIVLNQAKFPTLPPEVFGVVQQPVQTGQLIHPETRQPVSGTYYTIEYDSDTLGGSFTELEECFVSGLECVSCCLVLGERITTLETRVGVLENAPSGGGGTADPGQREYDAIIDVAFDPLNPSLPDWVPGHTETGSFPDGAGGIDAAGRADDPLPPDVAGPVQTFPLITPRNGDTFVVIHDPDIDRGVGTGTGPFVSVVPTVKANFFDTRVRSGNEFVVKWRWFNGAFTQPVVLEWPEAQITKTVIDGQPVLQFTSKTGKVVTWNDPKDKFASFERAGRVCNAPNTGGAIVFAATGQWQDVAFDQAVALGNLPQTSDGYTLRDADEGLYKVTMTVIADNPGFFGGPPPAGPTEATIDIGPSINGNDPDIGGLSFSWGINPDRLRQEITQFVELGGGDTIGLSAQTSANPVVLFSGVVSLSLERVLCRPLQHSTPTSGSGFQAPIVTGP